MELYRKGKVKEAYIDEDKLRFRFTDNISVFDKIIPTSIEDKGRSLCLSAKFWFDFLGGKGIQHHFLSLDGDTEMSVRKYEIIERPGGKERNFLVPLEFITRNYLAGSLYRKAEKGKVSKGDVGANKIEYGAKLDRPYFEITTKFEKFDRPVDLKEAMEIGGVTRDEIEEIKELCLHIDELMAQEVKKRGLIHVDGKKEFALDDERSPVIVDTFGTADEDRWWDLSGYDNGEIVELSKEFVRQHYIETSYYQSLTKARDLGEPEPEIPPLPKEIAEKTRDLYRDMYQRITGKGW